MLKSDIICGWPLKDSLRGKICRSRGVIIEIDIPIMIEVLIESKLADHTVDRNVRVAIFALRRIQIPFLTAMLLI